MGWSEASTLWAVLGSSERARRHFPTDRNYSSPHALQPVSHTPLPPGDRSGRRRRELCVADCCYLPAGWIGGLWAVGGGQWAVGDGWGHGC